MALPKITQPTFDFVIPSSDKELSFRPFLVREEKILLTAQQTKNRRQVLKAVKQVINNCCTTPDFDINALQIIDIEFLFLKLRGISVNNIIDVEYIDNEDSKEYKFSIDTDDIKLIKPKKKVSNKIAINEEVGITLKYADSTIIDKIPEDLETEFDVLIFYIKNCIKEIYDKEDVYTPEDQTEEELDEFVNSIPTKVLNKIKAFFDNAPRMEYVINYTNSKGTERKITLTSLDDFFTLG